MKLYKSLILYYVFKIFPVKSNKIAFYHNGFSGSNLSFLYDSTYIEQLKIFKIIDVNDCIDSKSKLVKLIINSYHFNTSKFLLYTHGGRRVQPKKKQIVVELWHGFPLKGMNYMDFKDVNNKFKSFFSNYIISSSNLYNTFFNACMRENIEKYRIFGFPRNDYLINSNGKKNLETILQEKLDYTYIFLYMPTFRRSTGRSTDGVQNAKNFFYFPDFDEKILSQFLVNNNILLLLKLHPFEENYFIEEYSNCNIANLRFLKNSLFNQYKMDLYKIINSSDLLITDYSSVYFDYLLLNKPILFTPTDINSYSTSRGFLVENYEFWTPGLKASNLLDFMNQSIQAILTDPYKNRRELLTEEIHKYKDGNSTQRLIDFLVKLYKQNEEE